MQYVISILEQHLLLVVFLNALFAQIGLPLPLFPILMTAAALASQSPHQLVAVVAAGALGALLGDILPYWCGRRYGRNILSKLCRLSLSPDFCVRRTESVFAKVGPWSLLFVKFIPGISFISITMAGVVRMSVPIFLFFDGIGKLAFVSAGVALGVLFQNAIASVLLTLTELGRFGVVAVIAALGLYVLAKWWRRLLFIRQLRMDRITVAELRKLIDDGEGLVILDVRPKEIRADGIIPGAIAAHPADEDLNLDKHPRDKEIVVYCDCPNEASAAIAAKHLKRAGFKKIRPLAGGMSAWTEAGEPIQRAQVPEAEAARDLVATQAEAV